MAVRFEADMSPVRLSSIEAIGYDPERRTMAVRFNGGTTHLYRGVHPDQHAALINADSIGGHFA
jgi:KTSC domain